ncbi:hypothetical protein D3C86_1630500 [compost metagenome]
MPDSSLSAGMSSSSTTRHVKRGLRVWVRYSNSSCMISPPLPAMTAKPQMNRGIGRSDRSSISSMVFSLIQSPHYRPERRHLKR